MTNDKENAADMGEGNMAVEPPATRCGFVALLGATNAGKSTLMNRLVGTKPSLHRR